MSDDPENSTEQPYWLIIGDSHVDAIVAGAQLLTLPCASILVGGATAVGMRNPNSATNALSQFRDAAIPARSKAIPVLQLGEVDCGFVIWYRAEKLGESIESQMSASIKAYFGFVDELLCAGYPTVVVTGAIIPTIRDGELGGEVANLRREVNATQVERTLLTLAYNAGLRREAMSRALPFIDLTSDLLDVDRGVIADVWRHPDPTDHHLNPETGGKLWAHHLNALAQKGQVFSTCGGGRKRDST